MEIFDAYKSNGDLEPAKLLPFVCVMKDEPDHKPIEQSRENRPYYGSAKVRRTARYV